jgi:hypothetical protein
MEDTAPKLSIEDRMDEMSLRLEEIKKEVGYNPDIEHLYPALNRIIERGISKALAEHENKGGKQ